MSKTVFSKLKTILYVPRYKSYSSTAFCCSCLSTRTLLLVSCTHRFNVPTAACMKKTSLFPATSPIFTVSRTMAGHSHWKNIQKIKAVKDKQKSAIIAHHCSQIRKAIYEGGSNDPKLNSKLASAIDLANRDRVPNSTIQATYKRAENLKLQICTIELQGPGDSAVLLEVEAENPTIAVHEMKVLCRRHGNCQVIRDGSIRRLFDYKGIVNMSGTCAGKELNEESAMELAIEAGAEEVSTLQDQQGNTIFQFITSFQDFYKVQHYLEKKEHQILYAALKYFAIQPVELHETELESFTKLQERLESVSGVNILNVYDNVQWDDDDDDDDKLK